MVHVKQYGPVAVYRMGRSIGRLVLYSVHAFMIGDAMIDTGPRCVRDEFRAALNGTTIRVAVNTHHHEDHTGNNGLLQRERGARIYAPPGALPYLANPRLLRLRPYQRVVWGRPDPSNGEPVPAVVTMGRHALNAIHAPGHSHHHICLHEPREGWLFTGDLFCGRIFKYLRLDENYSLILSTLKILSELECKTIFCSLKGVVEGGGDALRSKIRFMEDLRGRVLDLHERGASPRAITRRLLGGEGFMTTVTGGHYSKLNSVLSIIHNTEPEALA